MNQPRNKALFMPFVKCNCPHSRGIAARNGNGHAFDCPQYVNPFKSSLNQTEEPDETDDKGRRNEVK